MRRPPPPGDQEFSPSALASCTDLARVPGFGRCAPGVEVAWVYVDLLTPDASSPPITVWPAAPIDSGTLRRLPLVAIVVGTDGSRAAIEQARTVIEAAYPQQYPPMTGTEWTQETTRTLTSWQQLANVVMLATLAIAGCSLTVCVVGGLTDRKRPFSMLRLTGVPLGELRRVVALESAVPLLAAAVVAIGTGFLAAHLFLTSQMDYSLHPPGPGYYVIVLVGIAASLGIITSTLPLLKRITGAETARNE